MAEEASNDTAYREILSRLDRLRDLIPEKSPEKIPLIDPTANVLKLVEQSVIRMDDLFKERDKWQERLRDRERACDREVADLRERLASAESGRIDAITQAESRRIDAVLAEMKVAVSLAAKEASSSSSQLRSDFDVRVSRLEQQQYQSGGRDIQKERSSGTLRDNIGMVIGFLGLLLGAIVAFLARTA